MTLAPEIISPAFQRMKKLLFPFKKGYWIRMAILSFSKSGSSGNYSGSNSGGSGGDHGTLDLRQSIIQFNNEALSAINQHGAIFGILIAILLLVGLLLSFLSSVLLFSFVEGVEKGEIRIRKSFDRYRGLGMSLFLFRTIFGFISMTAFALILLPLLLSFFAGELADFNLWFLLPMGFGFLLFAITTGLVLFVVDEFLVPVMYIDHVPLTEAWKKFKGKAKGKFGELAMYWLMRLLLGLGGVIAELLIAIMLLLVFLLVGIIIFGIGYMFYQAAEIMLAPLIVVGGLLFVIMVFAFVFLTALFALPVRVFFQVYSLMFVKRYIGRVK